VIPGQAYVITAEVEDGNCADDFTLLANGTDLLAYQARSGGYRVVSHTGQTTGNVVAGSALEVTFRNTARDRCGLAAVYNVALEPAS
jgi:hypothetical protein